MSCGVRLILMPLPVYRLRRWLAVLAVMFSAVVAGMYLYARLRQHSVLKGFPGKISYDIKQTASGFQFSKSEAGRTVFTIRAKSVKEFKLNGRADLHDVSITLYGRGTSRFDHIYGDDFSFDPKSGDVTAKGEVQIDLEANPSGITAPDQSVPQDLKNPIHLKTRDLVFNRVSGDASTDARVDFVTPQATGWAMGVSYQEKTATLTLASQIHVQISGGDAETLFATHGAITREPRQIVLDHPVMKRKSGTLMAEQATFFLGPENEVQRIVANGDVRAEAADKNEDPMRARADHAELSLTSKQNLLRTATLTGKVHMEREGSQPMQGDAGRAVLDFHGQNELGKVRASEDVHLSQHGAHNSTAADPSQDFDLNAAAIDFFVIDGRRLDRAETSGAAKITMSPQVSASPPPSNPPNTVITAGRFEAKFAPTATGSSRLASMHGAPNAKIINLAPGAPDRVSTSQTLDATFLPQGGIASIVQQGSVAYSDNQPMEKRTQAWAAKAVYTPSDKILRLTGNPRVTDGGMATTATTVRIDRATGDAFAEGDVKSTYSGLKVQPDGALLASSSPIHVTAATMMAHNSPATALYQGDARLWQDANLIQAPSIQFDREHRSLLAQGTGGHPVITTLTQQKESPAAISAAAESQVIGEKKANKKSQKRTDDSAPITITAARLTYSDAERKAHYEGGVVAQGTAFRATSNEMDAYFTSVTQPKEKNTLTGAGHLEKMVAQGDVIIQEPNRRALGQTLIYTSSDDRFILTGGPPSIFDAERGKITGVSLTFFRGDDRVLVEGKANTPVVSQTRVTR